MMVKYNVVPLSADEFQKFVSEAWSTVKPENVAVGYSTDDISSVIKDNLRQFRYGDAIYVEMPASK